MGMKLVAEVRSLGGMTQSEKALLVTLASLARDATGWCWGKGATLAAMCSCSGRTIRRALARLEALGMLVVERAIGAGRCSRYRVMGGAPAAGEGQKKPAAPRVDEQLGPVPTLPENRTLCPKKPDTVATIKRESKIKEEVAEFLRAATARLAMGGSMKKRKTAGFGWGGESEPGVAYKTEEEGYRARIVAALRTKGPGIPGLLITPERVRAMRDDGEITEAEWRNLDAWAQRIAAGKAG